LDGLGFLFERECQASLTAETAEKCQRVNCGNFTLLISEIIQSFSFHKEDYIMVKKIPLLTILLLFTMVSANAAEDIRFKATSKSSAGDELVLTGKLFKPHGDGPFPALVLMHGCNGVSQSYVSWAEKINSWGYVTLVLDSFAPRGHGNICENLAAVTFHTRVQDAYDAKAYLSQDPFVNRQRIGVMGWSHGGGATLASVSQSYLLNMLIVQGGGSKLSSLSNYLDKTGPFQAATAFYPWCAGILNDTVSPLLILAGEKDTWTPAGFCENAMPLEKPKNEIILKVYPNATHAFDMEMPDRVMYTHKMSYNRQATTDATDRVRAFLKKYLQE
jgi:dienelactone hydrolase